MYTNWYENDIVMMMKINVEQISLGTWIKLIIMRKGLVIYQ